MSPFQPSDEKQQHSHLFTILSPRFSLSCLFNHSVHIEHSSTNWWHGLLTTKDSASSQLHSLWFAYKRVQVQCKLTAKLKQSTLTTKTISCLQMYRCDRDSSERNDADPIEHTQSFCKINDTHKDIDNSKTVRWVTMLFSAWKQNWSVGWYYLKPNLISRQTHTHKNTLTHTHQQSNSHTHIHTKHTHKHTSILKRTHIHCFHGRPHLVKFSTKTCSRFTTKRQLHKIPSAPSNYWAPAHTTFLWTMTGKSRWTRHYRAKTKEYGDNARSKPTHS